MNKFAVISMDVEDWYHTYFPEDNVDRRQSLLNGLDVALKIMDEKNIKGSFFVVGEIVDQVKEKIRAMDANGHDIACHNLVHIRPLAMNESDFEAQLIDAKGKIEEALGHSIVGYRAPSFGIDDRRLNIVEKTGFKYDSSKVKSQKSSKYGVLNLDGFNEVYPCVFQKNSFSEFEVSTSKFGNMNVLLGGGYIRMLPWLFMKYMIKKYIRTGKPYVMYIHPIDLSPDPMPHVPGISFDRFLRTHIGRRTMVKKFTHIINMLEKAGYKFVTFEQLRNIVHS